MITHPLASTCADILAAFCDGGAYAIIDYPNYLNPGDSAIWTGARALLRTLQGSDPAYVCTLRGFDAARCRKAASGGVVFFLGGGNFGAMYEKHHRRRLSAVDALRGVRVIMLPFSLAERPGDDDRCVGDTVDAIGRHGNVTLLAREKRSLDRLRDRYGQEATLCPDTAHAVVLREHVPHKAEVELMRGDREQDAGAGRPPSVHGDWDDMVALRYLNRLGKLSDTMPAGSLRRAAYDALARRKTAMAAARLGIGETVTTDRLHGVILGDLLGRRVIAMDNATGKVSAYVRSWAPALPNVELRHAGEAV